MLNWWRGLKPAYRWLIWVTGALGTFFLFEIPAIVSSESGDTLTEVIVNYIPPELYWVGMGAFGAWFTFHIARRQIRRYRREEND